MVSNVRDLISDSELKGTVGPWQRYALYKASFQLLLWLYGADSYECAHSKDPKTDNNNQQIHIE